MNAQQVLSELLNIARDHGNVAYIDNDRVIVLTHFVNVHTGEYGVIKEPVRTLRQLLAVLGY